MYLKEYLKQFNDKKIKLFVDMDGVVADYDVGSPKDYDKKRPLYDSIDKLEEISKMPNVELYIFSATRYSSGFEQKNWWLDTYAPFFKKENRIIISREDNNMTASSILKAEYLKNFKRDDSVLILIDDDPRNLKEIRNSNEDIVLLKDTVLVDDTTRKLKGNIETDNPKEKAREFCQIVKELADRYDLSFFVVTEGASATSNNGCEAVKNARDNHIKWEEEHNFDPYEDWSKDKKEMIL